MDYHVSVWLKTPLSLAIKGGSKVWKLSSLWSANKAQRAFSWLSFSESKSPKDASTSGSLWPWSTYFCLLRKREKSISSGVPTHSRGFLPPTPNPSRSRNLCKSSDRSKRLSPKIPHTVRGGSHALSRPKTKAHLSQAAHQRVPPSGICENVRGGRSSLWSDRISFS